MSRRLSLILALGALLLSCGGDDDDDGDPSDGSGGGDDSQGSSDGSGNAADASPPDAAPPDGPPPTPDAMPVSCDVVPDVPFAVKLLEGDPEPTEDLAFDNLGNVIWSDTINIYRAPYGGESSLFVPSLFFRAGMRMTPAGDLIVNNDTEGSLVKISPTGARMTLLSGLSYPNGMEIGIDGKVYVSEQSAQRVLRVDPATGDFDVMTEGIIAEPNGLTFNQDYTALYIAGFSGEGTIYKLPIASDGTPGTPVPWATDVGTGWLDGMGVDACGYVYIADYGQSRILRVLPDGSDYEVAVDRSAFGSYMPNFQWGSGIGGWDSKWVYIVAVGEGIFEVDFGNPSKPR